MITTVCLNPSFDKTAEVDSLDLGSLNRLRNVRLDLGGKGLNVAVVLKRLGTEVQCLGCLGAESEAAFLRLLEKDPLPFDYITMPVSTRTNLKILANDTRAITELNEPGPEMDQNHLDAFFDLLRRRAASSSFIVLSGSLPKGCGADTYLRCLAEMKGIPCVLDASGANLLEALPGKPFLIKPNLSELEEYSGRKLCTLSEICNAAREMIASGAQNVVVSLGKEGAVLVEENRALFAPEIPVTVSSTVGAGDAMVGGIVSALDSGATMSEAFVCGTAAGTASVMTEGTQLIRREDYDALLQKVTVHEI